MNNAYLLLRVRWDKKSRERNYADMFMIVRKNKKGIVKNDANVLLRVRQDKKCRDEM